MPLLPPWQFPRVPPRVAPPPPPSPLTRPARPGRAPTATRRFSAPPLRLAPRGRGDKPISAAPRQRPRIYPPPGAPPTTAPATLARIRPLRTPNPTPLSRHRSSVRRAHQRTRRRRRRAGDRHAGRAETFLPQPPAAASPFTGGRRRPSRKLAVTSTGADAAAMTATEVALISTALKTMAVTTYLSVWQSTTHTPSAATAPTSSASRWSSCGSPPRAPRRRRHLRRPPRAHENGGDRVGGGHDANDERSVVDHGADEQRMPSIAFRVAAAAAPTAATPASSTAWRRTPEAAWLPLSFVHVRGGDCGGSGYSCAWDGRERQ